MTILDSLQQRSYIRWTRANSQGWREGGSHYGKEGVAMRNTVMFSPVGSGHVAHYPTLRRSDHENMYILARTNQRELRSDRSEYIYDRLLSGNDT